MPKVLVTGARGFVGRSLTPVLRAAGHQVLGTTRGSDLREDEIQLDVAQPSQMASLPGDIDIVVHCAARITQDYRSQAAMAANSIGTARLARWAQRHGVRHFIHCSSIAVYGAACVGEHRTEDATSRSSFPGHNAYVRSKAKAERLLEQSGVPYTTLRLPAVFGPGDSFCTPMMLRWLRAGEMPWWLRRGRRYSTLDVRNFCQLVTKLVDHHALFQTFNCTCDSTSWDEFVLTYARALGLDDVPWKRQGARTILRHARESEFLFPVFCGAFGAHFPNERLRAATGWRPEFDWHQGVHLAISKCAAAL